MNTTSVKCMDDGYTFQSLGPELACSTSAYCPMPPHNPYVFTSTFDPAVNTIEDRIEGSTIT